MFAKVLIADRGEAAVRVERACREMGISTLAVYDPADVSSLHVRLADECVLLQTACGYDDAEAILEIARQKGADAIHPGYSYLGEQPGFAKACREAGIAFIGPTYELLAQAAQRQEIMSRARMAGYPTVEETISLRDEHLGRSHRKHRVCVQILGDRQGHILQLGEYECLARLGNERVTAESPSPCLPTPQRKRLLLAALDLACLFRINNAATLEFVVDDNGQFAFAGLQLRLQHEHSLAEMTSRLDLVREQIRIAAGRPLSFDQGSVQMSGWAVMGYIRLDPAAGSGEETFHLSRCQLPSGPDVRLDTHVYPEASFSSNHDGLIAKLTIWGEDRPACLGRMRRALQEMKFAGLATTQTYLQDILSAQEFAQGSYHVNTLKQAQVEAPEPQERLRDLAAAAAVLYLRRNQCIQPELPERLKSGWRTNQRVPSQWVYSGLPYGQVGSHH